MSAERDAVILRSEKGWEGLDPLAVRWGDELSLAPSGPIVKAAGSREVALIEDAASGRRAYCKRFVLKGPRDAVASLLLGSRARREFDAARRAAEAGVAVARPVLLAERRRCGLPVESFVATEEVVGATSVLLMWLECGSNAVRRDIVAGVGRFVRSIHDRGFYHDDLSAAHILARRGGGGGREFVLIDLWNSSVGRLGSYCRAKNLYQVMRSLSRAGMGRGGRFRLLRAYLGEDAGDRELRKWWKRIDLARFLKRGNYGRSRRYPGLVEPVAGGR